MNMASKEEKLSKDQERVILLIRAKEANKYLLLSKPHVIGLDIGYRVKDGKTSDERVVKVYVARKISKSNLNKEDLIPSKLKIDDQEVSVDVEEGTIDRPHIFTLRSRPLRGGCSIGPTTSTTTGTIGICVTLNDGHTFMLSCNHVLAKVNQAPIGTPFIQPSLLDGGIAPSIGDGGNNDYVGVLYNFVTLDFGTTTLNIFGMTLTFPNPNYVDAAIARVSELYTERYNVGNRELHWIGYPSFLGSGEWSLWKKISLLDRTVCKMGRTTEFTIGTIISVSYDGWVGPYENGQSAWFENQIRIEGKNGPFSQPGDSGSLVVDFDTREPIGMLFSGLENFTNANPLDEVMKRLSIPQI
jgi:hypothetical protein